MSEVKNTRAEMIKFLTANGYDGGELKNLKNLELEEKVKDKQEELKARKDEELEQVVTPVSTDAVEEGEPDISAIPEVEENVDDEPDTDTEKELEKDSEEDAEVVYEFNHQLSIHTPYIYNKKVKGSKIVVTNLGYGDIYVDTDDLAIVGKSTRINFNKTLEFSEDVLYFGSASQPQLQIVEVK